MFFVVKSLYTPSKKRIPFLIVFVTVKDPKNVKIYAIKIVRAIKFWLERIELTLADEESFTHME